MSKTITIDGISDRLYQVVDWLQENVGPVRNWDHPNRIKACGWEMWDADSDPVPTYIQTKIRFNDPTHATLFVLRWS